MRKGIVVEGDPLSNGGSVTKGSGAKINNFNIALLNDPVECLIHGKGTIVEADPDVTINDTPIALDGHKVSCGCTLIAKLAENGVSVSKSTFSEVINDYINTTKDYVSTAKDYINDKIDYIKDKKDRIDRAATEFLENNLPEKVIDFNASVKPYICELPNYIAITLEPITKIDKKVKIVELITEVGLSIYCFDRSHYKPKKDETKLEYTPRPGGDKELNCEGNKFTAGMHKKTQHPGMHSHHMPAKSAYYGSAMNTDKRAMEGPAIRMDAEDHRRTKSYGSKGKKYRQELHELIQQGKLNEAVQKDIDDLRRVANTRGTPDKYECGIKEFINYYNSEVAPNSHKFIVK